MDYTFASAAILMFLVIDPLGNIPLFSSILKEYDLKRRRRIIIRESIFSFFILLAFMLGGKSFLRGMHLTEWSMQIGGAIVLFLIAIRMIFPSEQGIMGIVSTEHEPFIVPLSIPGMAGPSSMATVMLLSAEAPERKGEWVAALAVVMTITAFILYSADWIQCKLGHSFTVALERLMGMILVAVSVQMLMNGLYAYYKALV
jgi:MarC family membrane protein